VPSPLNVTNIPAPRTPLTDPVTGLLSREWYRFFLNLFNLTGAGTNPTTLEDLQIGPPFATVDEINNSTDIKIQGFATSPSQDGLLAQIAELQKQVQAAELSSEAAVNALQAQIMNLSTNVQAAELSSQGAVMALQAQLANLATDVQALAVSPPVTPQLKRARYGSFYDTTTQTGTTINTAKAITFNTTDLSNGVYIGSPTSRIYVDTPGIYNYDMSFQLDKTSGGTGEFYIWFRLNGTNVANSASYIQIQGNNAEIFSSLNYFFDLNAGDYVEIMFSVSDLSVEVAAFAAAAPVPAIPSIILTVANNIEGAST
jgi:hypothetical protein